MSARDTEYAAKHKDGFVVDQTNENTGPVVRWKSNNSVPPDEILDAFMKFGWITELEHSNSIGVCLETGRCSRSRWVPWNCTV